MKPVKSIYIKALIAAFVLWVIAVTIFIADLYWKVGEVEHEQMHQTYACGKCGR